MTLERRAWAVRVEVVLTLGTTYPGLPNRTQKQSKHKDLVATKLSLFLLSALQHLHCVNLLTSKHYNFIFTLGTDLRVG